MRLYPRRFTALPLPRDRITCRTIRRLLPPAPDDLGDLEARSRGPEVARAPPARGDAAVAGARSRRLCPAGWSGRADRNRCRGLAQADALLSATGPAGGSLGSLCPRGLGSVQRARALG